MSDTRCDELSLLNREERAKYTALRQHVNEAAMIRHHTAHNWGHTVGVNATTNHLTPETMKAAGHNATPSLCQDHRWQSGDQRLTVMPYDT